MRILFINSVLGYGSTGKIVKDLACLDGVESLVMYGRKKNYTDIKNAYKTTNLAGNAVSAFETIVFNKQGFTNKKETLKAVKIIKQFDPDIIHLHVLHGYYINFEILLTEINKMNIPIIWTLHDCWLHTGYCCNYDYENCNKWKKECNNCKMRFSYPFSLFKQNVTKNYYRKKKTINNLKNVTFVSPSKWLSNEVKESFINQKVITIHNGIDLHSFKPLEKKQNRFTILFVAGMWTKAKGVEEMLRFIPMINDKIKIIIVGNLNKYKKNFEKRCELISYTNSIEELAKLYSTAHLLINPTLEENFPTVNIESLACGTPVLTYKTGGSPEIIDEKTGVVVDKGNYRAMAEKIEEIMHNYNFNSSECVERSKKYSKENMLDNYKDLYMQVFNK